MADVILIYPYLDVDPHNQVMENFVLPLSLLHIGTPLDQQNDKVHIIDMRFSPDWKEDLKSRLTSERPVCVGISSMTGAQIKWGIEASKIVRELSPEVPLVWGGVHPTLLPEQTLASTYVDIVVMGEGEEIFSELVNVLKHGKPLESVGTGICFEKDGAQVCLPRRKFIDLNDTPDLAYHLVDVKPYIEAGAEVNVRGTKHSSVATKMPNLPIITSRGCPHNCAYCYVSQFDFKKWRCMDAVTAIDRMRSLVERFNLKGLFLLDDNFFVKWSRAEEICRLKLKDPVLKGIAIFNANCRYDYIANHPVDSLRLFKDAGISEIRIGVEAGSEEGIARIMKQSHVEQAIIANKKLKEAGIVPAYNFMVGFPGETVKEALGTLKLMDRLLEDNPLSVQTPTSTFTPYPGTALYQSAIDMNWVPPKTLEEWAHMDWMHNGWWNSLDRKQAKFYMDIQFMSRFLDPKNIHRTSFRGLVQEDLLANSSIQGQA